MWLTDSPRTSVRGCKHHLITKGPPVRVPLHRLSKEDTELVEECIRKDVARGQLRRASSPWGAPAFVTKAPSRYKAVQRGRRLVVDYRMLNRVTVRKVFLIPNSDYIKSTVAGSALISVGDLKEGFNQVDNEPETRKKMAVLSAGGCWLPRGLTFGPTNGPEDFQELVFVVFQRHLYKEWYVFVDDVSVATGRKKCHGEEPSGAHDVVTAIRSATIGERASQCLDRASGQAFPSPFAHAAKDETSSSQEIPSSAAQAAQAGGVMITRSKYSKKRGRYCEIRDLSEEAIEKEDSPDAVKYFVESFDGNGCVITTMSGETVEVKWLSLIHI